MATIAIYDRANQELVEAIERGDRARVSELVDGMIPESEFEPIGYAIWESVVERLVGEMIDVESAASDRRLRRSGS